MEGLIIDAGIMGIRPLPQNSFSTGFDHRGPSKKGKLFSEEAETDKRLVRNEKSVICQPSSHLEATMIKSAAEFKFMGRKTFRDLFKAGVFVLPTLIPHLNQNYAIDKQAVVVSRARIIRCRPRFDEWSLEFQIQIFDDRIEPLVVKQVIENAGKYHGIGDFRPRYGLFKLTKFETVDGIVV